LGHCFDPDDFDAYEDAFLKHHEDAFLKLHEDALLKLLAVRTLSSNLLAQSFDVLKTSLHHILCTATEPTDFARSNEEKSPNEDRVRLF
jgi:hypothetical protein